MTNHIEGLRSNTLHQKLMSEYRFRDRTQWSEQVKQSIRETFPTSFFSHHKDVQDTEDIQTIYSHSEYKNFIHISKQFKMQIKTYKTIFGVDSTSPQTESLSHQDIISPLTNNMRTNPILFFTNDMEMSAENIKTSFIDRQHDLDTNFTESTTNQHPHMMATQNIEDQVQDLLVKKNLSHDQQEFLQMFVDYFKELGPAGQWKSPRPEPPFVLLTGDPGTGKSHCTHTLIELAQDILKSGHVVGTSYNGIAAFMIDGTTLCNTLGLPANIPFNFKKTEIDHNKILKLRNLLQAKRLCLFIVDEISTIDTPIVAMIDKRLQTICQNKLRFGGVAMLFVGDFNQLGPVKKTTIPTDMIEWAKHQHHKKQSKRKYQTTCTQSKQTETASPKKIKPKNISLSNSRYELHTLAHHGCKLLSQVHRVHLTTQHRSVDLQHSTFVKNLSKGHQIHLEDIKRYKRLERNDILKNPKEWSYATILAGQNIERMNFTELQGVRFSTEFHGYVIRWENHRTNTTRIPHVAHLPLTAQQKKKSFFWQYFVPNAKAFLSKTTNANLGLVNGSAVVCHSIAFRDKQKMRELEEKIKNLPFGSIIDLDEPPDAIVVIIQETIDDAPISSKRREQLEYLQKHSLSKDCVMIPILPSALSKQTTHNYQIPTNDPRNPMTQVQVGDIFPFELAFSMTIHKAQGRTIDRVILALSKIEKSKYKLDFAAVFVAMSRVKEAKHLRILPLDEKKSYDQDYGYLTELKASETVMQYYKGFTDNQGIWNPEKALDDVDIS